MITVKARRASQNDPKYSYTYDTSQLKPLVFEAGIKYIFEYKNGKKQVLKTSRNGKTLYIGKDAQDIGLLLPEIGLKVNHEVVAVYKQLKTVSE